MEFLVLGLAIFNSSCFLLRTEFSHTGHFSSCVPQHRYSKQTLLDLRPTKKINIHKDILFTLRDNNICLTKKTRRGKRGGKRKIKVVISSRSVDKSSRGVCLQNISRIKPAPTSFQFLTLNCQSVGNKELLLNDLVFDYKPDIVFFTETWLLEKGDEVRIKSLTPPLYVSDNFPRLTGPGGGILIINKNGTTVKTIRITGQSTFECTKSKININSSSITVFCVYRPPPSNKNKYKVTTLYFHF